MYSDWNLGSTFERIFYVADAKLIGNCLRFRFVYPRIRCWCSFRSKEETLSDCGHISEEFSKDEGEALYAEIEQRIQAEAEFKLHVHDRMVFNLQSSFPPRQSILSGRCFLCRGCRACSHPGRRARDEHGIQDGYNLAWKLALVLNGKADTMILETYNQERLENAKHLLQTTDRMFDIAAGSDWLLAFLRTTVMPFISLSDSAPSR